VAIKILDSRKSQLAFFTFLLAACSIVAFPSEGLAQARLDTSFGKGGIASVRAQFVGGTSLLQTSALEVGGDGKVLVAGNGSVGDRTKVVVVRLHSNGRVDKEFGTRGFFIGPRISKAPNGKDRVGFGQALDLDKRGGVLISGPSTPLSQSGPNWTSNCAFLARVTPAGLFDIGFREGGGKWQCLRRGEAKVRAINAGSGVSLGLEPRSIDVGGNGQILVGGQTLRRGRTTAAFVARYSTDGILDRRFRGDVATRSGQNGIVQVFAGRYAHALANEVRTLKHRKTLVVGQADGKLMVARLTATGGLDRSFAKNGVLLRDIDGTECDCSVATGVAFDKRGRIVVVGYWAGKSGLSYKHPVLMRFRRNGTLDRTFGHGGVVKPRLSRYFESSKVVLQNDGRIVLGGSLYNRRSKRFTLIRFLANGRRDRSFFRGGLLTPSGARLGMIASDVTIDNRGRVLATGGGAGYFSALRLLPGQ